MKEINFLRQYLEVTPIRQSYSNKSLMGTQTKTEATEESDQELPISLGTETMTKATEEPDQDPSIGSGYYIPRG